MNKKGLKDFQKELKALENPGKAKDYQRFFKTAPGQYGHGDRFYGIPVPQQRKILKKYIHLELPEIEILLQSKIHEERFSALQILVEKYKLAVKKDPGQKEIIYNFYISHTAFINNWDLVDTSAPQIVGGFLFERPRNILYEFAKSDDLWKKRISVLSTFYFIRKNDFKDALAISEILLGDDHDLIHKAAGWMIREIGNRDLKTAEEFLKKHARKMARTMLRYAIEKFPPSKRKSYLAVKKEDG